MKLWHVALLLFVTAVATLLAAAQVLTFIWLSSFPEQAHRIEVLEAKVWFFGAVGLVLLIVDAVLIGKLFRMARRKRMGGAPSGST